MLSSTEPEKTTASCGTTAMWRAQLVERSRAHVEAVEPQCAGIDVVEALQQLEDRALAGTRSADQRDRLTRFDRERKFAQHRHAAAATDS